MPLPKSKQEALTARLNEAETKLAEYEALWGDGDEGEIARNVERKLRYFQGEVEAMRTACEIANFRAQRKLELKEVEA